MPNTSVIGLGAMGAGMAANLHRAGLLVGAWNRTPERAQAAAQAHGFPVTHSLEQAVQSAHLVITCVSADQDLLEIGAQLLPLMPADSVLLDTSTVSAQTARQLAKDCAPRKVHFLDGPVSGGREGALNGTLVMMVGGDAQVLERLQPALQAISARVQHMGPVGSGQATKAVNQIMAAGINQAVTEALAFGQTQGLDMPQVIELLSGGAAGNWFLQHRGLSMCEGHFQPGFRLALHHKDLKICQHMAAQHKVKLPLVEMTLVHYERLMQQQHGDEDISTLFRLKRQMFGLTDEPE